MRGAIAGLGFVATLALFAAVFLLWYARRAQADAALRRRLGQLRGAGDALVREPDATGALARLIAESGLGWTTGAFAARVAVATVAGLLVGVAAGSGGLAVALGLGGAVALWIVVRRARARRLAQCDEQLPQALEIIALALRAGHALPGALALAAQECPAPLGHELRQAVDEHALGRPITAVIAAVGARLPGCQAIATFVVAVAVLEETGGNLIAVIDRIVDTARARSSYHARLRALTAEGRQSALLLALLPGAFIGLAMASDPSYGRLLVSDGGGRMILALTAALWAVGLLWTRRLVRPVS